MRFLSGLGQALRGLVLLLACAWAPSQAADIISPPQFSHDAGFHSYTFKLKLYHPDAGVSIFYTLDGSTPYVQFPYERSFQYKTAYRRSSRSTDGVLEKARLVTLPYRGPIKLARVMTGPGRWARMLTTYDDQPVTYLRPMTGGNASQNLRRVWDEFLEYSGDSLGGALSTGPDQPTRHARATDGWVDRAVVVRAVAVGPRGERSEVVTRTYFFGNPDRFSLPIVAVTADPEDLFGYDRGVMVAGRRFDAWRERNPAFTATAGVADANWRDEGDSSERAVHVEYLLRDPATPSDIKVSDQAAGLRIHGAFSRASAEKSMRLHARKRYGSDEVEVFGDFQRSFLPKQVILRSSSNDRREALMRDAVAQRVVDGLQATVSRSQPVAVFLNGEYWGLYHLRERLGDDHFAAQAKVKDSDIELSRNYGVTPDHPELAESWLALVERLEAAQAEGREVLPLAEADIDIGSFIDLHAAEVLVGNTDWPANNVLAWRVRPFTAGLARNSPYRKWHWAVSDMDMAFRAPNVNTLHELLTPNGPRGRPELARSTRLFRVLMKDPRFQQRFATRLQDLLNTRFSSERMAQFVAYHRGEIAAEVPHHVNRWQVPASVAIWERSVRHIGVFIERRPAHVRQQMEMYLALPPPVKIELGPMESGVSLRINGETLEGGAGRQVQLLYAPGTPLKIEVVEGACRRFQGWQGQGARAAPLDLVVDQPLVLKPQWGPACGSAAARQQGS
jgi:hypothetical protein